MRLNKRAPTGPKGRTPAPGDGQRAERCRRAVGAQITLSSAVRTTRPLTVLPPRTAARVRSPAHTW